ncbi:MAG: hypothetical protein JWO36_3306 [Myxococcales bacterium]|nr:hypothetical protein [Myxococcales bacterium]
MTRRLVLVLLCVVLAPGCKAMGGFGRAMGGLGHVASGFGRVAGHAASGFGRIAGHAASGLAHATPSLNVLSHAGSILGSTALRTTEAVAEAPLSSNIDYGEPDTAMPDPCSSCPSNLDCGLCTGYGGYTCELALLESSAMCVSTGPPNVVPFDAAN